MKMVLAIRERKILVNSALFFFYFCPFFSKSSQAFLQSGNKNWGRKMFKIIENFKILDLGFVDNGNLKGKISPSSKQRPSDPNCRLI